MFYKKGNGPGAHRLSLNLAHLGILALIGSLSACTRQHYVAEPIEPQQGFEAIIILDHRYEGFREFLNSHHYSTASWPVDNWGLHELTLAAIYFNPALKASIQALSIYDAKSAIAGQRKNPHIAIPLEHHSEDNRSPWLIGLLADFLFERSAKREARVKQALLKREAAQIRVEQQAWELHNGIHHDLIDYKASLERQRLLLNQQALLNEGLALLQRRYELDQASAFEISSMRLMLQQVQLQISRQAHVSNNAFHALIANTGLQANKFNHEQIDFSALDINANWDFANIKDARVTLLGNRSDIRAELADYQASETALRLAIQQQDPDINLSPGFVFDQGDKIWTLGAAWVLPLFHNNDDQIKEALAQRKHAQARFLDLQTHLINELDRRFQNYTDLYRTYEDTLRLAGELKRQERRINKQHQLGYTDSLSLVRARLEIEKANQALLAVEIDLLKSRAQLQEVLQQPAVEGLRITSLIAHVINTPG